MTMNAVSSNQDTAYLLRSHSADRVNPCHARHWDSRYTGSIPAASTHPLSATGLNTIKARKLRLAGLFFSTRLFAFLFDFRFSRRTKSRDTPSANFSRPKGSNRSKGSIHRDSPQVSPVVTSPAVSGSYDFGTKRLFY